MIVVLSRRASRAWSGCLATGLYFSRTRKCQDSLTVSDHDCPLQHRYATHSRQKRREKLRRLNGTTIHRHLTSADSWSMTVAIRSFTILGCSFGISTLVSCGRKQAGPEDTSCSSHISTFKQSTCNDNTTSYERQRRHDEEKQHLLAATTWGYKYLV